jgi:hypothetical protein
LKFEVKKGPNIIVLKLDGPWANPPVEEEAGAEEVSEEADAGNAEAPTEEPTETGVAAESDATAKPAGTVDEAPSKEAKP